MAEIRIVCRQDMEALKSVVDTNDLFPSDMLEGMMFDYFENTTTEDIWITRTENNVPIALAYFAPERLTEGTYNLYLIAIHKDFQGIGIGTQLMGYIEQHLK